MNVYLVHYYYMDSDCEVGEAIVGVYASEELAASAVAEFTEEDGITEEDIRMGVREYVYEEWEVITDE